MPVIHKGAIDNIFENYLKSSAGEAEIRRIRKDIRSGKIAGSGSLMSDADMLAWAEKLRSEIYDAVVSHIKSVSPDDITVGEIVETERGLEVDIKFNVDALHRDSLAPDKYPDGVDNIVLHFTTGWDARGVVRGEWHGKETWSLQHREGANFIESAVEAFGGMLPEGVIAETGADYR